MNGKLFTTILFLAALCLPLVAGQGNSILVDPDATPETVALYRYLHSVGGDKVMFGHHHTTCYGIGWDGGDPDRSDVKSLTGSHAAVYGWDLGHTGTDRMDKLIIAAHKNGGINTISWHMGQLSGKGGYKAGPKDAVKQALPGGKYHRALKRELDRFVRFNKKLKDGNGNLIPIIFRPWHEHTGGWFWWGSTSGTEDEFVALWKFTVHYLRDVKKVHNLIYAYSPSGRHVQSTREYETNRFPGYDYMDVLGVDAYVGKGQDELDYIVNACAIVSRLAAKHGKVAALTEFGFRNGLTKCPNPNWYMDFLKTLKSTSDATGIVWALTWRNHDKEHFWVPYKGQQNEEDFKRFFADPMTVFEDDLPDLY